jgi:hypothetical protein
VGTLTVKTVEYAVLKTHTQYTETPCIRQRLVFGAQCLEKESWHSCSLKRHLLRKFSKFFTQFVVLLAENEWVCWFQQEGATAHTGQATTAFLQEFLGEILSDHNAY